MVSEAEGRAVLRESLALKDSTWLAKSPVRWSVGSAAVAPRLAHTLVHKDGDNDMLAVFRRLDVDGSGTLTVDEMSSLLQTLDPERWSEKEVSALYNVADLNHDGNIDLEEFVEFVFFDETGKNILSTVFDSVPAEMRTQLLVASEDRAKVVIQITQEALDTMLTIRNPPDALAAGLSAVCWLLWERGSADREESWKCVLDLCLRRPRDFLQGLIDPPWDISRTSLSKAEEIAEQFPKSLSTFDLSGADEALQRVITEIAMAFLNWVHAVIEVHRALMAFGPLPEKSHRLPTDKEPESSCPEHLARAAETWPMDARSAAAKIAKPWAASVEKVQRKDLMEMKKFRRPPRLVINVFAAVCWMLTHQGHPDPYYSWRISRKMMSDTGKFYSQLMNPPRVTALVLQEVETIIGSFGEDFDRERAQHVNQCLPALVDWLFLVLRLQRKWLDLDPDVHPGGKLQ